MGNLHFIDEDGTEQTVVNKSDVDDAPVDAATNDPISSNWAYDHTANASAHHARYTDAEAIAAVGGKAWDGGLVTDTNNTLIGIDLTITGVP